MENGEVKMVPCPRKRVTFDETKNTVHVYTVLTPYQSSSEENSQSVLHFGRSIVNKGSNSKKGEKDDNRNLRNSDSAKNGSSTE